MQELILVGSVTDVSNVQPVKQPFIFVTAFNEDGNTADIKDLQLLNVPIKAVNDVMLVGSVIDVNKMQLLNVDCKLVNEFCAPGFQFNVCNEAHALNVVVILVSK
jgi:hypothetical protein